MLEVLVGAWDMIGWLLWYVMVICLVLLKVLVPLAVIMIVRELIFGKKDASSKTSSRSRSQSSPIVCDWSDADEAQRRAVRAGAQSHEDSLHLHDMAVRDAWEAHTMACDMHETAVEMQRFCLRWLRSVVLIDKELWI